MPHSPAGLKLSGFILPCQPKSNNKSSGPVTRMMWQWKRDAKTGGIYIYIYMNITNLNVALQKGSCLFCLLFGLFSM